MGCQTSKPEEYYPTSPGVSPQQQKDIMDIGFSMKTNNNNTATTTQSNDQSASATTTGASTTIPNNITTTQATTAVSMTPPTTATSGAGTTTAATTNSDAATTISPPLVNGTNQTVPGMSSSLPTSTTTATASPTTTVVTTTRPQLLPEVKWEIIWKNMSPYLLDPADIHSTVSSLMSKTTNKLSPAEVTFIQRRLRYVLRHIPTDNKKNASNNIGNKFAESSGKMVGRVFLSASSSNNNNNNSNNSNASQTALDIEGKNIVDKHHLINQHIFKRMLCPSIAWGIQMQQQLLTIQQQQLSDSSTGSAANSAVNNYIATICASSPPAPPGTYTTVINLLLDSAYTILLHFSESLWDRTVDIALITSKRAGLEMDVNKGRNFSKIPKLSVAANAPSLATGGGATATGVSAGGTASTGGATASSSTANAGSGADSDSPPLPVGITLDSLCFLIALGLRGKRTQRLQLFFYLMLPPKQLISFLSSHPAGGVPFWLLEVGNDTVISLPSMTHYQFAGTTFIPDVNSNISSQLNGEGDGNSNATTATNGVKMEYGTTDSNTYNHYSNSFSKILSVSSQKILDVVSALLLTTSNFVDPTTTNNYGSDGASAAGMHNSGLGDSIGSSSGGGVGAGNRTNIPKRSNSAQFFSSARKNTAVQSSGIGDNTSSFHGSSSGIGSSVNGGAGGGNDSSAIGEAHNHLDQRVPSEVMDRLQDIADRVSNIGLLSSSTLTEKQHQQLFQQQQKQHPKYTLNNSRLSNTNDPRLEASQKKFINYLPTSVQTVNTAAATTGTTTSTPASPLSFASPLTTSFSSSSPASSQQPPSRSMMNMQEFFDWAEIALDDAAIDVIFFRLFATGILPSPALELDLVLTRWMDWHKSAAEMLAKSVNEQTAGGGGGEESIELANVEENSSLEVITQSIRKVLELCQNGGTFVSATSTGGNTTYTRPYKVWGGLGGFDGGGVTGGGVLYCIDKKWWDKWLDYVGWNYMKKKLLLSNNNSAHQQQQPKELQRAIRPQELSTESLLDRDPDSTIAGTLGSYELMKRGLIQNKHYVLVPPAVWDVLFELYGGGPPLPRPVLPPQQRKLDRLYSSTLDNSNNYKSYSTSNNNNIATSVMHHDIPEETTVTNEILPQNEVFDMEILRIPEPIGVAVHPWIVHLHLCDPQQPYRRGDAGPMSIRVMATPDQPLWRLYAEAIVRLPLQNIKAYGTDGRGKARFWKKISPASPKDPLSRYGPWTLLCKNRHAILPRWNTPLELEHQYQMLRENWQAYADNATVEGIGLADGDHIMVECAIVNKNGEIIWPREAAAKAGRVRRLADEDMKFRQLLRGVDDQGAKLENPPNLVGMTVDAMDSSGRWYQVQILKVEVVKTVEEGDDDEDANNNQNSKVKETESKQVKVDFSEYGGHFEWIDTDSDRLATAGRFTMGRPDDSPTAASQNGGNSGGAAAGIGGRVGGNVSGPANAAASGANGPKTLAGAKKSGPADVQENGGKVCNFPGYGACGLANLGNTCYINSAVQCIGYMPLLRAYILNAQYRAKGDINRDNPLGTGGKLLEEFAELLRLMWSARQGEKSPTRFRGQLGKARSQFSGADQQDAQEFLNYILDVLHEDSNKVRKKPYVEALEDDWVKRTKLFRVGEEAWRRFLRRNHSIMSDVAMGQVLNTVTCPVCHFSSRNFDPFNLLSIPIPTVADVIFQCTVIRRATTFNCPWILNKPRKGDKRRTRFNFNFNSSSGVAPPSEQFVSEQYIIAMSRLADSGDLRLQIQNICGIPANSLRLCRAEETVIAGTEGVSSQHQNSVVARQLKVTPLSDKEGPCSQLARQRTPADAEGTVAPTQIVAFETTLSARPPTDSTGDEEKEGGEGDMSDATAEEDEEDDDPRKKPGLSSALEKRDLERLLEFYGDDKECRIFDTDPFLIAKAVSRSLWPRSETELKLGLRVDAIDHRGNWFPGSVVEFVEGGNKGTANNGGNGKSSNDGSSPQGDDQDSKTKVRVHFDNFSSKWDEFYTIDHFKDGKVRPLYSHSSRRTKPTEFIVHHRYTDSTSRVSNMFGQSFYVQCQNEWSTARAGAHILGQATRFLQRSSDWSGPIDLDDPGAIERDAKVQRLYERTHSSISDLIDLLVDCDREYVRLALGVSEHNSEAERVEPYRNPTFDASAFSSALVKKVTTLLHRLPFEVRVCTIEATVGGKPVPGNEENNFPFSLMRTIGNYMNARHAVVLQWKEPPTDKKSGASTNYLNAPVMYVEPSVAIDRSSAEILKNKEEARNKAAKSRPGSGGLHLGVCLTEFCKVQQLSINDNWRCPRCKDFREGKQNLLLWRLPDLLTFHIKRFNCSARWREKISTKVNFPLTGLDMSEWCHKESPVTQSESKDSHIYDLIGVINHYGSMTGGHYVAVCKATACGKDGREEAGYYFNGAGASNGLDIEDGIDADGGNSSGGGPVSSVTGWRIGRSKSEVVNQSKVAASVAARQVSESAEPLWLQYDDDLVEPVPPKYVVSEMAYVLFYRRRRLTPSNIAKYSTLD